MYGVREKLHICALFVSKKEVVHMESDWHWLKNKNNLKKEGEYDELFRIWWTICTTSIERKTR